jgi:choline dehydrogenase
LTALRAVNVPHEKIKDVEYFRVCTFSHNNESKYTTTMSGWERLDGGGAARGRGRGNGRGGAGGGGAGGLLGFLAFVVFGALLAWAIAMTVVAANRVDPPGTFQCGAATGRDGDLCYDYIIIGGGTAGLGAAKTISDDPRVSVLVLEAGQDYVSWDSTVRDVPSIVGYLGLPSAYPNRYYYSPITQPEPGLNNVNKYLGAARTLGGGSSENFMFLYRGSDPFWDDYDVAVGSPGTFDSTAMHEVYQSIEWLDDSGHYATTATRGFGELPSQRYKLFARPVNSIIGYDEETFTNFMSSAFGLPGYFNESYNNPGFNLGIFPYIEYLMDFNQTGPPQVRWSGRFAFMNADVMDQNTYTGVYPRRLKLMLNATVSNLISLPGPQFVGANFRDSTGRSRTAYAARGVIMSAGIHDSGILQRSGVGPAAVLQNAGISPVLVNENVGNNFRTQVAVSILAFWPNITAVDPDGANGLGATASQAFLEDVSPIGVPGKRAYHMFMIGIVPTIGQLGIFQDRSASSGSWWINSFDPYQAENVVTNALTNSNDTLSLRDEIRYIISNLTAQDPFFFPLNIDGPTLADDALLDAWLRTNAEISNHYFSQCRMGTDASTSVVDNRFRVWNTAANSLRVCDLSAMAYQTDDNPSYPAAALGTICGRMVLEDAGLLAPSSKHIVKKMPKNPQRPRGGTPRAFDKRAMTPPSDVVLWQAYQNAITAVSLKYSGDVAQSQIAAIKQTADYIRLCAIYC